MTASEHPFLSSCFCETLRRTTRAVTRVYDDALRPLGLRVTQYAILNRLRRVGRTRIRDLGEATVLDDTTLVRSVRGLEKEGWVTIRQGDDKRERWVEISPAGKKLMDRAAAAWADAQARMKRELHPAIWEGLFRDLPDVTAAATSLA